MEEVRRIAAHLTDQELINKYAELMLELWAKNGIPRSPADDIFLKQNFTVFSFTRMKEVERVC